MNVPDLTNLTTELSNAKREFGTYGAGEVVTLGVKDGLPFGGRGAYGGARMVAAGNWSVSTSSSCQAMSNVPMPSGYVSNVRKFDTKSFTVTERAACDGVRFDTQEEADAAAYEAGALEYFFYVKKDVS